MSDDDLIRIVNKNLKFTDENILSKLFEMNNIKLSCLQDIKIESDSEILFKNENKKDSEKQKKYNLEIKRQTQRYGG